MEKKKCVGEPGKGQNINCMLTFGNLFLDNGESLKNAE